MASLPSNLSHSERDKILRDIPLRPFPTYGDLPYPDFLHRHLIPNAPFLLSSQATKAWPSCQFWRIPSVASTHPSSGEPSGPSLPNLPALRIYGNQVVPVANTSVRQFSEFEREELPLNQVLDTWSRGEGASLYVKDWHLVAELEVVGGRASDVYAPPECLRDDWLSPPFDQPLSSLNGQSATAEERDADPPKTSLADFRFVYLGPAGTFTPLHRDVYASYSWSANVVGRKVWWLFPPGVEDKLRTRSGDLMFDVRGDPSAEAKGIKVLQQEGEVIFVPSGWHHQVVNVDFCISINHNFFSSPTLPHIYQAMVANHARVADSIEDIKCDIQSRLGKTALTEWRVPAWQAEFGEEVERLLEMDAGWGWGGFWRCVRDNLLHPPAQARLSPSTHERDSFIRQVLDRYRTTEQWRMLPEVRAVAEDVDRIVNSSDGSCMCDKHI